MDKTPQPPIHDQVQRHQRAITEIKEALAEHRIRLENGTKVFADVQNEVASLKPKPPNALKIIGLTLSTVGLAVTAVWVLAQEIRDRPTKNEVDAKIEPFRQDLLEIHKEQAKQRQLIEGGFEKFEKLLERRRRR